MNVVLGPDVYANASVAPQTPPDRVVQLTLGNGQKAKVTPWILDRVRDLLNAVPAFKKEAIDQQINLIRSLVEVLDEKETHEPNDWVGALTAAAKLAGVPMVVTDHPTLLEKASEGGIDFISTENYLVELSIPPPPPTDG